MSTRIYTRSGDSGNTGLFGGQRVAKDDLRVEAYGAVDELNASIGAVRALAALDTEIDSLLGQIQHDLFQLGADLATPDAGLSESVRSRIKRVTPSRVDNLEQAIDRFEEELPPLRQFILPGGHPAAAYLHLSRTVCRRAERRTVTLTASETEGQINPEVVRYLNRLSDLLFVLARAANQRLGVPDVNWDPEV